MSKHVLDPKTFRKRGKTFKGDYNRTINALQEKNHLNGLNLLARIPRGFALIESKFKGKPKQEITLMKSIFFIRNASKLTDAYVDTTLKSKKRELSIKERTKIWSGHYDCVMEMLLPRLTKHPQVRKQIGELDRYFSLPERLHKNRGRHWRLIEKIIRESKKNGMNPRKNLETEMDKILTKSKRGHSLKAKAMDVCVASSIYADLMKEKGKNWTFSYREGMEIAYSKIKGNNALIEMIINLK